MSDWNSNIIEEFRENEGQLGGTFEGWNMLLLHHAGAKTGTQRVNPLTYQPVGDSLAIFASKAGDPRNPDWFHNLVANPDTKVEIGTDTIAVTARVAADDERDKIWTKQKELRSQFADYEVSAAGRKIPVIILERR
ncbi:MAG: nitroreductase family deazaflavin-dependent oxidoreductase [Acidimicrobiia bacterium]